MPPFQGSHARYALSHCFYALSAVYYPIMSLDSPGLPSCPGSGLSQHIPDSAPLPVPSRSSPKSRAPPMLGCDSSIAIPPFLVLRTLDLPAGISSVFVCNPARTGRELPFPRISVPRNLVLPAASISGYTPILSGSHCQMSYANQTRDGGRRPVAVGYSSQASG